MLKDNFKKLKLILAISFIFIELAIFVTFICIDILSHNFLTDLQAYYFEYTGVILCALFSISLLFITKSKQGLYYSLFRAIAHILTLVCDYFLLIRNSHFELGVSVFIAVQVLHYISLRFLYKYRLIENITFIGLRILLPTILFLGVHFSNILGGSIDTVLVALVSYYFMHLLLNFVESIYICIKTNEKQIKLLALFNAIGFFLFIGCDIFVGLNNILIGYQYALLSWVFYLPSQVILASSGLTLSQDL